MDPRRFEDQRPDWNFFIYHTRASKSRPRDGDFPKSFAQALQIYLRNLAPADASGKLRALKTSVDGAASSVVQQFIGEIAAKLEAKDCLDPLAGINTPLSGLGSDSAPRRRAIPLNDELLKLGQHFWPELEWYQPVGREVSKVIRGWSSSFDVIMTFGASKVDEAENSATEVLRYSAAISKDSMLDLMLACQERLRPGGQAWYLLPRRHAIGPSSLAREAALRGVHVSALIALPADGWQRKTSAAEHWLCMTEDKAVDSTFVAQLKSDPQFNKTIIENLFSRSRGNEVAAGRLVALESFKGLRLIALDEEMQPLVEAGWRRVSLASLAPARRAELEPGAKECARIVIPIHPLGLVCQELPEQPLPPGAGVLVIERRQAEPDFVIGQLKSAMGRLARWAAADHWRIGEDQSLEERLGQIEVAIPTRAEQRDAVALSQELNSKTQQLRPLIDEANKLASEPFASLKLRSVVESELDSISRRLQQVASSWSRGRPIEEWLVTLPYPLAGALWRWHAMDRKNDLQGASDQLEKFFEASAQFYVTLLLSGLMRSDKFFADVRRDLLAAWNGGKMNLNKFSMGLWVRAAELLGKRVRGLLASRLESSSDSDSLADWFNDRGFLIPKICSDAAVIQLFAEAVPRRNDGPAHRFVTSEMTHAERHQHLSGLLERFQAAVGDDWQALNLIRPLSARKRGRKHENEVRLLTGPNQVFRTEYLELDNTLDTTRLHVHARGSGTALELLPLVVARTVPGQDREAICLVNRVDGNKLRLLSTTEDLRGLEDVDEPEIAAIWREICRQDLD
jgi:hypothetical protein